MSPAVVTFDGGDMLINVLNHTLDIGIGELQEICGQLDARKLRVLAIVGDDRLKQLPGVATLKEQGIDLSVRKFRGLAGPKGMPAPSSRRWNRRCRICCPIRHSCDLRRERVAARLHAARSTRVHLGVRQADGSVPQRDARHQMSATSRDFAFATVMLAVGLAYYWLTQVPQSLLDDTVGPVGLPRLYAVILVALSLIAIALRSR